MLTNSSDRSPVGQECKALSDKQTRGETHYLFKQVLQPATQTLLWENHLLEELILPEGVNRNQISSGKSSDAMEIIVAVINKNKCFSLRILTRTQVLSWQTLFSASWPTCWLQERRPETQQHPPPRSPPHSLCGFWIGGEQGLLCWPDKDLNTHTVGVRCRNMSTIWIVCVFVEFFGLIPALIRYSRKSGNLKRPASMARVDLTPGNASAKPQLSVLKQANPPALMIPCGWMPKM